MSVTQELTEYVRACFGGVWIGTNEPIEAFLEIAQLCRGQNWQLATWSIDAGLQASGLAIEAATDPLAAVRMNRSRGGLLDGPCDVLIQAAHVNEQLQSDAGVGGGLLGGVCFDSSGASSMVARADVQGAQSR